MFLRNIWIASVVVALATSTSFAQTKKTKAKKAAPSAETPTAAPEPKHEEAAPAHHAQREEPRHHMEESSEYQRTVIFLHPKANQNEITPKLNYQTASGIKTQSAGTDIAETKTSATNLTVQYMYGLSDYLSVGGNLGYLLSSTQESTLTPAAGGGTSKTTASGMDDIFLSVAGAMPMEGWAFEYGADLGISPGKSTSDQTSSVETKNNANSGGLSLAPYIGAVYTLSTDNILGAKLSYNYLFEQIQTVKTTGAADRDDKLNGGAVLTFTPFYEYQQKPWAADGYLIVRSTGDVTTKNGATSVSNTSTGGHTDFGIGLAWSTFLSETSFVGIQYEGVSVGDSNSFVSSGNTLKMKSYFGHNITVGGKWYF